MHGKKTLAELRGSIRAVEGESAQLRREIAATGTPVRSLVTSLHALLTVLCFVCP